MKNPITILVIIALMVLAGALAVLALNLQSQDATGSVTKEYSYTKAICDDKNFCQDHVIVCSGENLVSQTPIEGATLQNSLSWKDPRPQDLIDKFC